MRTADPSRYVHPKLGVEHLRRFEHTSIVADVIDGDRHPCPYHRVPLHGCRSCLIEAMLDELIALRRAQRDSAQLTLEVLA